MIKDDLNKKNQKVESVKDPVENQELKTGEQENPEAEIQCCHERDEWKDKFLRTSADLQNYKKRIEKEMANWALNAQEPVFLDLLAIVDHFDRAFHEYEKQDVDSSHHMWIEGFRMINKELYKLLEKYGVSEITNLTTFNPEFHEAVMQIKSEGHSSGEIVQVLQKGFMRNGRVLRPAKVSVAE